MRTISIQSPWTVPYEICFRDPSVGLLATGAVNDNAVVTEKEFQIRGEIIKASLLLMGDVRNCLDLFAAKLERPLLSKDRHLLREAIQSLSAAVADPRRGMIDTDMYLYDDDGDAA